jgi:hypothetical protein
MANPAFKTGRYTTCIPDRLAGKYLEAQADPDLIGLRDELSLLDARLADVLTRVDTKEAGVHWANASNALQRYNNTGDAGAMDELRASIGDGLSDYAAWNEVFSLIERRRKLCETETKRLAAMGQQITAERAMILVAAMVDIVRRNVTDPQVMRSISGEVNKLIHRGDTHPA